MQRSCAHRRNPRGRSWTGPCQATTSGQPPRSTESIRRPAPKHSANPTLILFMKTKNGTIARQPAAMRQAFLHQRHDESANRELTRPPNHGPSESIQVNPTGLPQTILFYKTAPASAKPPLSHPRSAARPRVQKRICANLPLVGKVPTGHYFGMMILFPPELRLYK